LGALISSVLAFGALTVARVVFPVPSRLKRGEQRSARQQGFTRAYWLYMVAAACFGAMLLSYEFISFHLSSRGIVKEHCNAADRRRLRPSCQWHRAAARCDESTGLSGLAQPMGGWYAMRAGLVTHGTRRFDIVSSAALQVQS
jgi:hypothetical protein